MVILTTKEDCTHLQLLYWNAPGSVQPSCEGMTAQASPATARFPTIQKLASTLRAAPRRELGWNSA